MKFKELIYFFLGGLTICVAYWTSKQLGTPILKNPEIALGEMLYVELQKYPNEWKIENIASVMKGLSEKKRVLQPANERDGVLLAFASKEAERIAKENLLRSEDYLSSLALKSHIIPIVDKRVYIEILKNGFGQAVSQSDQVLIDYKQYNIEGQLIKDTNCQVFEIPVSRMIKGFKLGIEGAKIGEKRKIYIHPEYGFGKIGRSEEPNQLLIYEITINAVQE